MVNVGGKKDLVFLALLASLFILMTISLTGCSDCREVKYYENEPIIAEKQIQIDEEYETRERYFETVCSQKQGSEKEEYEITYEDMFWLYEDGDENKGNSNQLKKTAYLENRQDVQEVVYIKKVFLHGKEVVERSAPMKAVLNPGQKRRFFLTWNTPYDATKDITIEMADQIQNSQEYCMNITKYRNITDTRPITMTTNETAGYKRVIKTKTVCD